MGFPVIGIGAMAFKTLIGKNGADVKIIADFSRMVMVRSGVEAGG